MKKILLASIILFLLSGCSLQKDQTAVCLKESFELDKFLKDTRYWGDKTKINEIFTLKDKCLYEIEEREYSDRHGGTFTIATFYIYDYSKRQKVASYNIGQCFGKEEDESCLKIKENESDKYFELRSKIQEKSI